MVTGDGKAGDPKFTLDRLIDAPQDENLGAPSIDLEAGAGSEVKCRPMMDCASSGLRPDKFSVLQQGTVK